MSADAVNPLEESYLKHVLTAVRVRDVSAPFAVFFDKWFAFRSAGPSLNTRSRPHWFNAPSSDPRGQTLNQKHFLSQAAARTLAGLERNRLVSDHAVPVPVLRAMLFEQAPTDLDSVRHFLQRNYRIGVITDEESHRLAAAGLRSAMPQDWSYHDCRYSRYKRIGVAVQTHNHGHTVLMTGSRDLSPALVRGSPRSKLQASVFSGLVRND